MGRNCTGPKSLWGGGGADFLSGFIVIGFFADSNYIRVETYPDIPKKDRYSIR